MIGVSVSINFTELVSQVLGVGEHRTTEVTVSGVITEISRNFFSPSRLG